MIKCFEGYAYKAAYIANAVNIISQRHRFEALCINSCVGNVFDLRSIRVCFSTARKLTYVFAPTVEWGDRCERNHFCQLSLEMDGTFWY